jgi:hypothetical protein
MVAIGALAAAVALAPVSPGWTPSPQQTARLERGEVVAEVRPDPGRSSGVIEGAVIVHAPAAKVWGLLTDCAGTPRLVALVKSCRILEADPAGAWDVREHILDFGLPLLRFRDVFYSDYTPSRRALFRCVPPGQFKGCAGEWRVDEAAGGDVRVTYQTWAEPPLPLPTFIVRTILKSQVVGGLTNLRRRSEEAAGNTRP